MNLDSLDFGSYAPVVGLGKAGGVSMTGPSQEQRIRERAYALWEGEGRSNGNDREYWLRAEAEIAGERRQGDAETRGDTAPEKRRTMKAQKGEARPANGRRRGSVGS